MKGLFRGLIALAVVGFVITYFGSPFLAVRDLTEAGQAGDEAALNRLVDFPEFRNSLKQELTDRLMAEVQSDPRARDSGLGGLGMMFGPMLVGGAVDAMVNAHTIAVMVQTAKAPDPTHRDASPSGDDHADIKQTYGYRDLNTFALGLTDPDRPTETLKLLLKRQGLFGWKLAGIDLPAA